MDMDFWTVDNFLLTDERLDLSDAQQSGHYGDLKLDHDLSSSVTAQDAVGGAMSDWSPSNEEGLGLEWMESSDLGSYLDVLDGSDGSQEKLLPIEPTQYEMIPSPPTDLGFVQVTEKEDVISIGQSDLFTDNVVEVDSLLSTTPTPKTDIQFLIGDNNSVSTTMASFDAVVSPPGSPVQVAPVIKLEETPIVVEEVERPSSASSWDLSVDDGSSFSGLWNHDLTLKELDFSTMTSIDDNSYVLEDARQLISSPLSVDDVEDTLASSLSSPSSPDTGSTSLGNIIETCPELYKVISSSTIAGKRFSPYQKSKSKATKTSEARSVSKSDRKRAPAEPVPEHVIVQQVNKKDRKKLQNKNAAIRYRMKKKEEAKDIKLVEQGLEEINTGLKSKVEDLEREIKYMKNLMEEVYKAKGIIKSETVAAEN